MFSTNRLLNQKLTEEEKELELPLKSAVCLNPYWVSKNVRIFQSVASILPLFAVTHLLGRKLPECMWLLTVCHFPTLLLPASTLLELSLRLGPAPVPPPTSHFSNEPLQTVRRTRREGRRDGVTDAHRKRRTTKQGKEEIHQNPLNQLWLLAPVNLVTIPLLVSHIFRSSFWKTLTAQI